MHLFKKTHDVMWCTNAEEALGWLGDQHIPSLIICDYELPGMNGLEFLKRVKSTGFFKEIPVIMLSGKVSNENRINCLEVGAEDFVIKPFNPSELRIKVQNLLSKTRIS